jgi:serine/threonine protein kinase
MDPLVGRTLDNKYLIEKLLGKGGMGSVYQAIHTGTKRTVAVKVIAPQFMRNRELLIRFQREAEASGRLRHPNVVNVTDFGVTVIDVTSVAYLVMEYLDGETLFEYLQKTPIPPPSLTIDVLEQIALGVSEAHRFGILHRDLKPQNIWLQPDGRGGYIVKVLDFGIAKLADPSTLMMELPELEAAPNVQVVTEDENATQVLAPTEAGFTSAFSEASGFTTTVGATLGTPAFMAPEQCCGKTVNEKSDLYSLAMIAYMMLAGELPFKGNARELIEQQITLTPDAPHTRNSKLSELVSRVVLESLAKDPQYRAPDCISFMARLRAAVEGEVDLLKESRQWSSGNTGVWFAILFVAILPGALALNGFRNLIRLLMEGGLLEDWQAFALILPFHAFLTYVAAVFSDMAMTKWIYHLRDSEPSFKGWLVQIWETAKVFPRGAQALLFTASPLRHGLSHIVALMEDLDIASSRKRSEVLVRGSEHLVLALTVRRLSIAWLVALYLPVVLILAQAPLKVVFREAFGGIFGSTMAIASFSFMPIYGSFLMAWQLLYERSRRSLGEENIAVSKRYETFHGKVGERVRLGTQLWGALPALLVVVLLILPFTGWNERFGDTLSLAVREGRMKDATQFLSQGADPNMGRGPGSDPLLLAVQNGDEKLVSMLIDRGAKPEAPTRTASALHFSVSRRRLGVLRLLLERGANVNAIDDRENTPLMLAAKSGQIEMVRLLLERGADRELVDAMGAKPSEAARKEGHTEIVKLLEAK